MKKPCITLSLAPFLSTLSLRRATIPIMLAAISLSYFYPRSPYGERLGSFFNSPSSHSISIHALLTESDYSLVTIIPSNFSFLSTLSLRRATAPNHNPCSRSRNFYPRSPYGERHQDKVSFPPAQKISIHALLTESDRTQSQSLFA